MFSESSNISARLLFLLGLLVLGIQVLIFWPFLSDDALISLRYADRLVDGLGLTWSDGPKVEGYSNLLWVLLSSGLHSLGMDLILAVRIMGILCAGVMIWLLSRGKANSGSQVLAISILTTSPFAIWAIGGLESILFATEIALMLNLMRELPSKRNTTWWISFVMAACVLTRPDGALIGALAAIPFLLSLESWKQRISTGMVLAFLPAIALIGQLLFRLSYYGEWVPNTALVKISPSLAHLGSGFIYLGKFAWSIAPVVFLAIFLAWRSRTTNLRQAQTWISLSILIGWSAYVLFIGGDYFPGFRHGLPLMVAFAFWVRNLPSPSWPKWGTLTGALFILLWPWMHRDIQRAMSERWEWDSKILSEALVEEFGESAPVIAVTAAGSIPYWTGFEAIDLHGLNDYHLPRNKPENYGQTRVGHGLSDPEYVLSRKPDLIVFDAGNPDSPMGPGRDLLDHPDFHQLYVSREICGAQTDPYCGTVYVLREFLMRQPE